MTEKFVFPEDFLWGAATSAYQIEGSHVADSKGLSIWDAFVRRPGTVSDRTTGDSACDHYRRMPEDVRLMADMGLKAYRFSLSWPRIFPSGRKPLNHKGLDFYRRLVDQLRQAGIEPVATLYHWDLPESLERAGGWGVRATAEALGDYAAEVAKALGADVRFWLTLNEPLTIVTHGYLLGDHAPGRRNPLLALRVIHHLLLAHGLAAAAIRSSAPGAQVGLANNFYPYYPRTLGPMARSGWIQALLNRSFMDPIWQGAYPSPLAGWFQWLQPGVIRPGDFASIRQPLDFLGVNYYTRLTRRALFGFKNPGSPKTDIGWEIFPQGFFDLLEWLDQTYDHPRILVTENGAAYSDRPIAGRVADQKRIDYLKQHLAMLHRALTAGIKITGYCCWSLLDNFEWARGLSQRFGLVYVDYSTQQRLVKASGEWYRRICRTGVMEW